GTAAARRPRGRGGRPARPRGPRPRHRHSGPQRGSQRVPGGRQPPSGPRRDGEVRDRRLLRQHDEPRAAGARVPHRLAHQRLPLL
ncbi:MAG: hypothetical protein AVDCRST_MAG20-522, partial [uncultured Acidimicrobiales bacterium]